MQDLRHQEKQFLKLFVIARHIAGDGDYDARDIPRVVIKRKKNNFTVIISLYDCLSLLIVTN